MQRSKSIALFVFLLVGCTRAQPANSLSSPTDAQVTRVKVFAVGQGVTPPEFLPLDLPQMSTEACKRKQDGNVQRSLLVDTTGRPRNIMFVHPLGTDLDKLVLLIVGADRFNPGLFDGKPVVVAEYMTVGIQTCLTEIKGGDRDKPFRLQLRSPPVQKLEAFPHPPKEAVLALDVDSWRDPSRIYQAGGEVSRAAVLYNPQAEFTDAARKAKVSGSCTLSVIVDTQGMPQNVQLLQRSIGYGLDEEAVSVVNRYRFMPAMKNDEPVAVKITVIVNFQLR